MVKSRLGIQGHPTVKLPPGTRQRVILEEIGRARSTGTIHDFTWNHDMNIQPKPHYIQSMQRSSTDPITLIEEMVDNSFDAGAMEVNVHIEQDSITIKDDGVGCPDLSVMLTLGDHADHGTTRSGTNGIGFKDAAIGFGDQLRIQSTVGSGNAFSTSVVEVDWRSVMRSDSWEVHDPRITKSKTAEPGTVVTISQLRKSRQRTFRKEKIARLVKELSWRFRPGLVRGKKITLHHKYRNGKLNRYEVLPASLPSDGWTESAIQIEAKSARIRWRKAEAAICDKNGFWIAKAFRMVENTLEPAGTHNGTAILCLVELDDTWDLSKHKDELIDDNRDELFEVIQDTVEGDLKKWSEDARTLKFTTAFKNVTDLLMEALQGRGRDQAGSIDSVEHTSVTGNATEEVQDKDSVNQDRESKDPFRSQSVDDESRRRTVKGTAIKVLPAVMEDLCRVQHTKNAIVVYLSTSFEPVRSAVLLEKKNELCLHACYSIGMHAAATNDRRLMQVFARITDGVPDQKIGQEVAKHLMRTYQN